MSYDSVILADSPRAYYKLNEVSGTSAADSSGNSYTATLSGVSAYSQTGAITTVPGDTAIAFGANGGLLFPNALNDTTFSALTLEWWNNDGTGWHHVVASCDGSVTTTYLDGALSAYGTSGTVNIGALFDYAGEPGATTMERVALYNHTLSATQVSNHYQAATTSGGGGGGGGGTSTTTTDTVTATSRDGLVSATSRDCLVSATSS